MSSRTEELARQRALLALLGTDGSALPETSTERMATAATPKSWLAPASPPHRDEARVRTDATTPAGLRAYQRNAQATARRVLRAHYPTVAAMLGGETLDTIALILWQLDPPRCGDLGEWGAALPELLAGHPDLRAWPWLADSARLDWARHVCERAGDASLDAASLQRLGDTDPTQLHLALVPGLRLLASPWPLLALWSAHQDTTQDIHAEKAEDASDEDTRAQAQAQAALTALTARQTAAQEGGNAVPSDDLRHILTWRGPDWRIHMVELSATQASWMRMLRDAAQADSPPPLSELLDQSPADLDFGAWLKDAVSAGWLWRVGVLPAPEAD